MTVYIEKPAVNLREELASLRNQGGYQEQQFWMNGLVTNGTFDADTNWTKGTGWTISGGVAAVDTSVSGAGVSSKIAQNVATIVGQRYYLSCEVTASTNVTANEIFLRTAGNLVSEPLTSTGTYGEYFVANSTSTEVKIEVGTSNNGDETMSIDNISVFEVDANDDVVHRMPKGWKPKDVFEDGLLQREGAAHDYEVVYDGFDYFVKPAVAPSATTQTCVIGVKA